MLHREGSIPACAGKPWSPVRRPASAGVHPRVRGETEGRTLKTAPRNGPSPRARGNHQATLYEFGQMGSIPACAGKPRTVREDEDVARVHPRVRGETVVP